MAAAVPNRLGEVNNLGGAVDALFLKMYAGMVLEAFARKNQFEARAFVKNITAGKSASFPALGRASGGYHTPGAELTGGALNHNEIVISTDGQYVSDLFISEWDELVNHFETRSKYASEQGKKLATVLDIHYLIELYNGSQASATVADLDAGTTVTDGDLASATDTTKVQALVDFFRVSAQTLDEHDAPEDGRFCVLKPQEYYLLVNTAQTNGLSAIHADVRGEGSLASGQVLRIDGIDIVKSNNLPQSNIAQTSGGDYDHHFANMTNVTALVGVQDCVGITNLQGIKLTAHDDPRRLGELLIARMVKGVGYLRPECCIAAKSA